MHIAHEAGSPCLRVHPIMVETVLLSTVYCRQSTTFNPTAKVKKVALDSHNNRNKPRLHHREYSTSDCHRDRKSTRLNSSHVAISYAVLCLKKQIRRPI